MQEFSRSSEKKVLPLPFLESAKLRGSTSKFRNKINRSLAVIKEIAQVDHDIYFFL